MNRIFKKKKNHFNFQCTKTGLVISENVFVFFSLTEAVKPPRLRKSPQASPPTCSHAAHSIIVGIKCPPNPDSVRSLPAIVAKGIFVSLGWKEADPED